MYNWMFVPCLFCVFFVFLEFFQKSPSGPSKSPNDSRALLMISRFLPETAWRHELAAR